MYENPWFFHEEVFDSDQINGYYGFVYLISNLCNDRKYIGRKYFWSFTKKKGQTRRTKSESDWKNYYGSCPELKEDIKKFGKENFQRMILSVHTSKGQCNYEETRQLFINNVLTESLTDGTPAYYNSNILGRYMRKDYYGKTTTN
jgi:hypothetical protein